MPLTREVVQQRLENIVNAKNEDSQFLAKQLVKLCQIIFKEVYEVNEQELKLMEQILALVKASIPNNFDCLLAEALVAEHQKNHARVVACYEKIEARFPEQWYVFAYHAKWLSNNNQHLEAVDLLLEAKRSMQKLAHEPEDYFKLQHSLDKLDGILMGKTPAEMKPRMLTVSGALTKSKRYERTARIELAIYHFIKARELVSPHYCKDANVTYTKFFRKKTDDLKRKLSFSHQNQLGSEWISLFGSRSSLQSTNSPEQRSAPAQKK